MGGSPTIIACPPRCPPTSLKLRHLRSKPRDRGGGRRGGQRDPGWRWGLEGGGGLVLELWGVGGGAGPEVGGAGGVH